MKRSLVLLLVMGMCTGASIFVPSRNADGGAPTTLKSDRHDQEQVFLTVYNSNRALVHEIRRLKLPGGLTYLWFQDVASSIMPETVGISSLSQKKFQVLEQNYEYDLLSPSKMLEKYINHDVVLVRRTMQDNTEKEERVRARLLSVNSGTVWQIGDKIAINPTYAYLEFPELPANLYARPTLVWLLDTAPGDVKVETSYLTSNVNWKADYVFVLDEGDKSGDMLGWVTINNQSGVTYENARLKLIAGDVHTVQVPERAPLPALEMAARAESLPQFAEKEFFEYHMYTLQRPATVHDHQQKQIELTHAQNVGVDKQFILRGYQWYYTQRFGGPQKQKVEVAVRIENSKDNGLGIPLPKGIVRVYKKDSDGSSQFIGEDNLDHTPRDEKFYLTLGDAFDIVAERRQTEFKVLGICAYDFSYEVKIRNHKKKDDVTVRVIEPLGGDWTMLSNSHPYTKLDAFTVEFSVPVPVGQESILTYRVQGRFC